MTIHNRAELTLECLRCIKAQTYTNYTVVIVDDGSTDGSVDRIRELYKDAVILTGDGALWWTAGMNKGIAYILRGADDSDLILTLNDDTYFESDYFQNIMVSIQKAPGGCMGSLLKNYYDRSVVEDSGVRIEWDGYRYKQIPFDPSKLCVSVDTLSCRGTVIPVSVFKKIGYFDERIFPHYLADYEFFIRANRQGIPLVMSYESVIFNKENLDGTKQKKSLWWRMFNRKSSSNVFNHYSMILCCSPNRILMCKNMIAYTFRSVRKILL